MTHLYFLKAIFGIWPSAWVIPTTLSLMCEGSRIFIMFLDLDFLARFLHIDEYITIKPSTS